MASLLRITVLSCAFGAFLSAAETSSLEPVDKKIAVEQQAPDYASLNDVELRRAIEKAGLTGGDKETRKAIAEAMKSRRAQRESEEQKQVSGSGETKVAKEAKKAAKEVDPDAIAYLQLISALENPQTSADEKEKIKLGLRRWLMLSARHIKLRAIQSIKQQNNKQLSKSFLFY